MDQPFIFFLLLSFAILNGRFCFCSLYMFYLFIYFLDPLLSMSFSFITGTIFVVYLFSSVINSFLFFKDILLFVCPLFHLPFCVAKVLTLVKIDPRKCYKTSIPDINIEKQQSSNIAYVTLNIDNIVIYLQMTWEYQNLRNFIKFCAYSWSISLKETKSF